MPARVHPDVPGEAKVLRKVGARIRELRTKRGMTMQQVVAERPTRDYDVRWGSTKGDWTTDMFVEAIYQTLGK